MTVTWETLDWDALDRLRERFITGAAGGDYWQSARDLASYDLTFAQRIGWKWDAVLAELQARGWKPPAGPLLDWGCGSGIAHRCVLDAFGTDSFPVVRLHDRSALAMQFATARARQRFPAATIESVPVAENVSGGTLLLSHVLNELSDSQRTELTQLLAQADAVLWVEPGTHADSRALIAMRERLLGSFHVVAPCTHQAACGLLALGNERHWCHHFATPPKGLKADPNWVHFSQRAGIDLRSVPYSFLVLERKGLRAAVGKDVSGWQRVLGSPRVYKGFARLFTCAALGVEEIEVQRRLAPDVFKAMEKGHPPTLVRGEMEAGRFTTLETR